MDPLEVVLRFVRAVEAREPDEVIDALIAPDIVHHELPNRLFPAGVVRDRAALLAGRASGRKVLSSERYDVQSAFASGGRVAVEIAWSGVLAVPYGELPIGHVLRASIGMFADVEDGRIVAVRNYDCYAP